MNRNPLYAVVAFAVLGLIAVFLLRQPEKGESASDRERPLQKLDAAQLDTLVVTRGGATTTIKKEGDKYKVIAPVAYPADEAAAKAGFDVVANLELTDLVSQNKAKHAEFELEDGKAIHVVAKSEKNGGKVLADLLVGKFVSNGTMVRLAGKDDVWKANSGLRVGVDKGPADWRDKAVISFPFADAETVTVKAKDGMAVAKKAGKGPAGEDKFELVSSVPKIDKLDNSVPTGILNAMASLKATDFADGVTPAQAGLDAPSLTVVVGLKGGKNATLLIGNTKGEDDYYVKNADAPQVYTIKKGTLAQINKRPIEFKDKTLCDLAEPDLTEVSVNHGADSFTLARSGAEWKATKPAKLVVDPAKTPSLAGGFKDWKATSFAEDTAPAVTGLAKPKATIVAKPKSGDACSFKVGEETKDKQNVYLQSAKSPDIYLAPKWSIDRILVKVDDLKKK
jgi:hypothetical protein